MIDVSLRAKILELMLSLKNERNLTYVFITHDLAVAKYISDWIAIMYLGEIVEIGRKEDIFSNPCHPYTKALLAAIPVPDPKKAKKEIQLKGEVPSSINPPSGCKFHPRCNFAMKKCRSLVPLLHPLNKDGNHQVACHLF